MLALAVLSLASVIAHWESAACVTDCARRPAGYPAALDWVLHRLVWRNPPGITAATFCARGMGVLIGAFVPLTVLMGIASAVHYRKYRAGLRAEVAAMVDDMNRDRILLLVATDVERAAVLRRVATEPGIDYSGGHPVQRLGVIGGAEVLLAQTGPGVTGPLSTAYSVPELLREWRPKYLIMLGICYGLREEEQGLGDVLVGERLQVINLRVGETDVRDRGDAITAGHRLVERFRLAVEPPGVRIHRGTLLSWDLLVDFAPLRAALKDRYPDALGGEMEGAGVYAASARASTDIGTEWIVVKAICDWGRNKTGEAQARAAANAATVVLDLIETGAFARYEPR